MQEAEGLGREETMNAEYLTGVVLIFCGSILAYTAYTFKPDYEIALLIGLICIGVGGGLIGDSQ